MKTLHNSLVMTGVNDMYSSQGNNVIRHPNMLIFSSKPFAEQKVKCIFIFGTLIVTC